MPGHWGDPAESSRGRNWPRADSCLRALRAWETNGGAERARVD